MAELFSLTMIFFLCTWYVHVYVGRVVHACRGVLNKVLPDVHIEVDHFKGKEGGDSPGYSLSLVAETTSGALLSTERMARPAKRGVNGSVHIHLT